MRLTLLAATLTALAAWSMASDARAPAGAPVRLTALDRPALATEAPVAPTPPVPAALQARIEALGAAFEGEVGIAVRDVETGWTASWNGDRAFPQQSVSKLWVAVALLDAADRGQLRLDEVKVVRREDLSVFHQPIARFVDDDGWPTTLAELLRRAITESDNAANEILLKRVGGAETVRALLRRKGVTGVVFGADERALQSAIAGLEWRLEYAEGRNFQTARAKLPPEIRRAALEAYLASPMDGATPVGVTGALARLKRGELLSPAATARLLEQMSHTRTGPRRLGGGLAPGWRLAHKTGTGQVLGPEATGYNDVGLLIAPDGRTYAVAVMIGRTRLGVPRRQELMSDVTRAVIAHHEGRAEL